MNWKQELKRWAVFTVLIWIPFVVTVTLPVRNHPIIITFLLSAIIALVLVEWKDKEHK